MCEVGTFTLPKLPSTPNLYEQDKKYGKFVGTFQVSNNNTKLVCEIYSVNVQVFGAYI